MSTPTRMGRPITILRPGETFSYVNVIKCNTDKWLGENRTTYEVRLLCCGQETTRSHKQLVLLRRGAGGGLPPKRCSDCTRSLAPRPRLEVERNEREVLGLLARRERAAREKAERVAARRAANQAAVDAAHRRAMGTG